MALDTALFVLGLDAVARPIIDLNFRANSYLINGSANSFAAVLTTTAYGPFNPAHIVAGVGWVVQAGAGGADDELQLTPGAFATLNGQPITVVMEHEIITPGGQSRSDTGAVISYASDDLNTGWQVDTNPAFTSYSPPVGAIGLKDESGGNLVINTTGLVSKLATLFGPNQISASNNGAATQSLSPSVQPAPTLFMIDNYAEKLDLYVVRRVTIYPAVAPALLPAYSS